MWNRHLVEKYSIAGTTPRGYIHSIALTEQFDSNSLKRAIIELPADEPISLFLHIPFCDSLCYCDNTPCILSKSSTRADEYLDHLEDEIEQLSELIGTRPISDIHWGGDSPTILTHRQIRRLSKTLERFFNMSHGTIRQTIDVNPGTIKPDTLTTLRNLGFNQLNVNIDDLDPKVQKAINRKFNLKQCQQIIENARELEFCGINITLRYGLPHQTVEGFASTLKQVILLNPKRITLEHYQHNPSVFKHQRNINNSDLPTAVDKLIMFENSLDQLTNAQFRYINMGQFTRTNDELCIAQQQGALHRNVQGFTTSKNQASIGLGVSAMSQVSGFYGQNASGLFDYYEYLEQGQLAIDKGYQCTFDSSIRQSIIEQLICQAGVKFEAVNQEFDIDFVDYFSRELEQLKLFEYDGLIKIDSQGITIEMIGRLLVRNICIVFDSGLSELAGGNPLHPV